MKQLTFILLFLSCGLFAQTKVKTYIVDCSQNTVVRDSLTVKELIFVSNMLPMSYNTQLKVYSVIGEGFVFSPSSLTNRRPKKFDKEPTVIVMGCRNDFLNLKIGKFINVEYRCNDNVSN